MKGLDMAAWERDLIALRRDFHRYPESGWTEFRTTARIIEKLEGLGLSVKYGPAIHDREKMFGLSKADVLESCWQRAGRETDRADLLEAMRGGYTGCIAEIEGVLPGPTIAIRVDIDCNDVEEARCPDHIPTAEGFRSVHENCMHACGHDAHAAIGIGAARLLCAARDRLRGKVRLIFQPGEEGLRGAASLTAAGCLAGCDALLGIHVGLMDAPVGTVAVSCKGFLASTKFDAVFHGVSAHAALAPEKGRNALAAAASAALDMLAIPEHPDGVRRVNVGSFRSEGGRNIIPGRAELAVETRGETTAINADVEAAARACCQAAAEKYGCTCDIVFMGAAGSASCDQELAQRVGLALAEVDGVGQVLPEVTLNIGEDITTMMADIQARGGQATELIFGMPLSAPHHNERFDLDERLLAIGAKSLAAAALDLGKTGKLAAFA